MTTQTQTAAPPKKVSSFQMVVADLNRYDNQLATILPKHIPTEKFKRVLIGALSARPDIIKAASSSADAKNSLIRETQKAATDGLILDGREATLTTYLRKKKKDRNNPNAPDEFWEDIKYMPMVQGVLKRMRNSGMVSEIECRVVFENDVFQIEFGDNAFMKHVPWYVREDERIEEPGAIRLAYVSAKLSDGTRVREVMNKFDIAKVKAASKSKDKKGNPVGPWKDHEEEMWRKSVLHRASKYLPKSSDRETGESVTQLLDRDAELYDVGAAVEDVDPDTGDVIVEQSQPEKTPAAKPAGNGNAAPPAQQPKPAAAAPKPVATPKPQAAPAPQQRRGAAAMLNTQPPAEDVDPETGEIIEQTGDDDDAAGGDLI